MNIIAHRGYWLSADEKNTVIAFNNALSNKFGIETDIRDFGSELVISHDIPNAKSIKLADFFDIYKNSHADTCLALNIKSCGLATALKKFIQDYNITNYFFFDMAVPDTLDYFKNDLRVFTRISEFEDANSLLEQNAFGVWLDEFIDKSNIIEINAPKYIKQLKAVAIVSPELHKRPHENMWKLLKSKNLLMHPNAYLCTDFPLSAKSFFN